MKFVKSISQSSWIKIIPLIIVLVFVISVVGLDFWGLVKTPAGFQYNYRSGDLGVYFNYMNQTREGRFLFCNQFTSEPHACVLFFPLWWLGGVLAGLVGLSNQLMAIILRLVLAAIFAGGSYFFLKKVFAKNYLYPWLVLLFGGGIFIDYFHSNVFLAFLANALNGLVYLLYLALFYWLWKFSRTQTNWRQWLIIFLTSLSLTAIHPYEIVFLGLSGVLFLVLVLVFYEKFFSQALFQLSAILASCLVSGVYYGIIFLRFPALGGWLGNNYLPVGNYWGVVLNFGFLLPLAIIGLFQLKKVENYGWWLWVAGGMLAGIVAIVLPLYITNKLFLPWFLPLALLSGLAIVNLSQQKGVIIKNIALVIIGCFLLFGNELVFVSNFPQAVILRYLPNNYYEPWAWLVKNDQTEPVVLAHYGWNTFIGAYCQCRDFIGGNQTNDLGLKEKLTDWFYAANNDDERKQKFLQAYHINYVFYSPLESSRGSFLPQTKKYLQEVYYNSFGTLYRVVNSPIETE